jgi:hypothetical protein
VRRILTRTLQQALIETFGEDECDDFETMIEVGVDRVR